MYYFLCNCVIKIHPKLLKKTKTMRYTLFIRLVPLQKPIIPHRLLQRCWCRTTGITFINHRVEDRLFSPAALLWCAVTVNIKAQSPATPMPLIAKSLSAGACYGSWSLQTNPEWGGLQSLLVPTNTALWNTRRDTVTLSLRWDTQSQISQLYQG